MHARQGGFLKTRSDSPLHPEEIYLWSNLCLGESCNEHV